MSAAPGTSAADPAALERELSALWRAEAEALKQAGGGQAVALGRVLLLTLAVFSPSPALANLAREVAVAINPRQPGRTIIMEVLPSAAANGQADPGQALDAWVTLHCTRPAGGHQQVCGEQITLEVPAAAVASLPGAVLPLLLPNVPSFLWWQSGSPFGQPILKELAPVIDRLIVDSFTFAEPEADLVSVAAAVADPRFHAVVSDLSWARLGPWRYQTAQLFDAPALRPYLGRLQQVTVTYCEGSPALAWLFAGWLAARLQWKPLRREQAGAAQVATFDGGRRITLASVPPPEAAKAGYFYGVQLAADHGAQFQVNRDVNECLVAQVAVGDFKTERVRPIPAETHVQWVGHELGRLAADPVYESAVRLLAGLFKL